MMLTSIHTTRRSGPITGGMVVLGLLLIVWQPLNVAIMASGAVDAIAIRGLPLALMLMLRLGVAAFGIAAGLALLRRDPAALAFVAASIVASAVTDVFVYTAPFFPNNRMPGDTSLAVGASLAYYGVWLTYVLRSKRLRSSLDSGISL